jgi:cytokinin riboside 5'-monophosphate phosphoribohydrolase
MNICVFSGSSKVAEAYNLAAAEVGRHIGERGHNLIYGGSQRGLMGAVARGVKKSGGKVIGIIPKIFQNAASGEDELIVTKDFYTRIQEMEKRSEGFITLPGGIGSLLEALVILQSRQLNQHLKPLVFLNINNFYSQFLDQLDYITEMGFAPLDNHSIWHTEQNPIEAIKYLENCHPVRMSDKEEFADNS